jgi:hypothetical protein
MNCCIKLVPLGASRYMSSGKLEYLIHYKRSLRSDCLGNVIVLAMKRHIYIDAHCLKPESTQTKSLGFRLWRLLKLIHDVCDVSRIRDCHVKNAPDGRYFIVAFHELHLLLQCFAVKICFHGRRPLSCSRGSAETTCLDAKCCSRRHG